MQSEEGAGSGTRALVVDVVPEDGATIVRVAGDVDAHSTAELDRRLADAADRDADLVVLEVSGVTFIDSTGLRTLVAANTRLADRGGRLVLRRPTATLQRLLEITGLDASFDVD